MIDDPEAAFDADPGAARERFSYVHDVHGSVSLLLDSDGNARASYGYTAYGAADDELTAGDGDGGDGGELFNPFGYSGHRSDSVSGTLDMGARRFGPDTTRFLQPDALGQAVADVALSADLLTANRYALAGGNPVTFVEHDGHVVIPNGGGGGSTTSNPADSPTSTTSSYVDNQQRFREHERRSMQEYRERQAAEEETERRAAAFDPEARRFLTWGVTGLVTAHSAYGAQRRRATALSAALREGETPEIRSKAAPMLPRVGRWTWFAESRWFRAGGPVLAVAGGALTYLGHREEGRSHQEAGLRAGLSTALAAGGGLGASMLVCGSVALATLGAGGLLCAGAVVAGGIAGGADRRQAWRRNFEAVRSAAVSKATAVKSLFSGTGAEWRMHP